MYRSTRSERFKNADQFRLLGDVCRSVSVPMKVCTPLLMIAIIALGCRGTENEPASSLVAKDFDAVIETIATSKDRNSVMQAYRVIVDGGRPAIDALRGHLDDDRTIPGTFSTWSFNGGTVTMADQSFFLIKDMIEPHNWKRQSLSGHAILTRDNLEQWLDQRHGKSISGLKIDATSESLESAKQEFEKSGSADSRDMIQFYDARLMELRRTN